MTLRIVLSLLLLLVASCAPPPGPTEPELAPAELPLAEGIGTSPSAVAPLHYGVWVDVTTEAADARALAGEPPDVVVYVAGHTTGSDAIAMAAWRWPDRHVVRVVTLRVGWVAREAASARPP